MLRTRLPLVLALVVLFTAAALGQQQIVTPDPVSQGAGPGEAVSFDAMYTTDPENPSLTGLGLRIHFDSSKLTFVSLTNRLATGFISESPPQPDSGNQDGDADTDQVVLIAWADIAGNWPGSLPTTLFTANFATAGDFTAGSTAVNFTASSVAAGYTFASTSAQISAPQADLSLGKTASPSPVVYTGANLTYTLTATNNGPDAATGVTVVDTLPGAATFVSAGAGCAHAAGIVTCTIGDLAAGASTQRTITVTAPGTEQTLTNSAVISGNEEDPNPANNSASAPVDVEEPPPAQVDVSVTKSGSPDPVKVGENLLYSMVVANAGPDPATNVSLVDTLPAGVTFVSASSGCVHAAGVVTCDLGTLASGAQTTVSITVVPTAEGEITNSATVSSTEADAIPANNTDTDVTQVVPLAADLSITKTASDEEVGWSYPLTYTVTARNLGPDPATGVTVTDTLPGGVTFGSVSTSAGSCGHAAGVVTCAIASLGVGAQATITIQVTAPEGDATLVNTATVAGNEADPVTANNSAQAETAVVDPSTLLVTIPTLSEWGLILLLALLAGLGWWTLTRRNRWQH